MATTKLTRRGKTVLAVAAVGAALGYAFGGRSLNAVVVPAAALLGATRLYVYALSEPSVERTAPGEGYQGDRRTVKLVVEAPRPYPATIRDRLSNGLRGDSQRDAEADGRALTYDVELAERGVASVGPCSVRATDPFGLWTVGFVAGTQERVTVFPRVHDLRDTAALLSGYVGVTDDREQFAGVREYERGDPLRDVNWKASAKRPSEFAVTEYAGEGATDRVTVAAEAVGPRADSVAEAAASVAVHLLDAGVAVGVATASGRVEPAHGDPHRRRLLAALAAFERGRLPERHRVDADVVVHAPETGEHVTVTVGGTDYRYAEFVGGGAGPERTADREGVTA